MHVTGVVGGLRAPRWLARLGLLVLLAATGCQAAGYGRFAQWSPPSRLRAMQEQGQRSRTLRGPGPNEALLQTDAADAWRGTLQREPRLEGAFAQEHGTTAEGWRGRSDRNREGRGPDTEGNVSSGGVPDRHQPANAAAFRPPSATGEPQALAMVAVADANVGAPVDEWTAPQPRRTEARSSSTDASPDGEEPFRVPLPTTE